MADVVRIEKAKREKLELVLSRQGERPLEDPNFGKVMSGVKIAAGSVARPERPPRIDPPGLELFMRQFELGLAL